MIAPVLEELSKTLEDVVFLKVNTTLFFCLDLYWCFHKGQIFTHSWKVDVDDVEEVAAEYKITAMPTFIFLKKKEQVSVETDVSLTLSKINPFDFSQFSWRNSYEILVVLD